MGDSRCLPHCLQAFWRARVQGPVGKMNCPSDSKPRHRPRLAGIWEGGFTPGTPVSTQRKDVEKTQMTKRKDKLHLPWFSSGHSGFHKHRKDLGKETLESFHEHLNLTFLAISLLLLFR